MALVVLRLVPQGGVLALQRGPRQAWIHPEAAMEAIHLQEALPTAEETAVLVQTPRGTRIIPLARVDPEWAKRQITVMLREWYMHPNGSR